MGQENRAGHPNPTAVLCLSPLLGIADEHCLSLSYSHGVSWTEDAGPGQMGHGWVCGVTSIHSSCTSWAQIGVLGHGRKGWGCEGQQC